MTRPLAALAVAIGMLASFGGYPHARSEAGGWREIAWPFPRDGWPAGRAFRCAPDTCGGETEVYVRPKLGFCNCDSGVADDDEVDRVADLDLISPRFVALEPGRAVRIADMAGRSRAYDLGMSDGARHSAIGIALSRRCDLLVAVGQGKGRVSEIQRAALEFIGTRDIARWIVSAMDGR
jgi:hypothetical protein